MSSKVKAIPEGYQSVTPYLIVNDAAKAIEFYKNHLGATEKMRLIGPNGAVMHCELMIGGSMVMLADACDAMGFKGPEAFGGSPVSLAVYLEDVDRVFARALECGCTLLRAVETHFYGDRSGVLKDPFGHIWNLSTHVEDVSEEEMGRRFSELMKQQG